MKDGAASKGQILVVDDDADFRFALASTFESMGYSVQVAGDGHQALDLIAKHTFEIVVSDIRMPNGDGIHLLEKTKQFTHNVPIVLLLTGFADITTEEAYKKGAAALFSKPLDSRRLTEMVKHLLAPKKVEPKKFSPLETGLDIELHVQGDSKTIATKALNLTRNGLYVTMTRENCLNVNDQVRFKFFFDGEKIEFMAGGVVRWANIQTSEHLPAGCGVDFLNLLDRELNQLLAYIDTVKKAG